MELLTVFPIIVGEKSMDAVSTACEEDEVLAEIGNITEESAKIETTATTTTTVANLFKSIPFRRYTNDLIKMASPVHGDLY
jgi:hypothetical protein